MFNKRYQTFPIGLLDIVRNAFIEAGIHVEIIDKRKKNNDSIEVLESEKARPFVFEKKIAAALKQNKDKNVIMPSLPKQDNHFLNEYLPKYTLEKIEIVVKNGKSEKVLKKYDRNNIAELLISEFTICFNPYEYNLFNYVLKTIH